MPFKLCTPLLLMTTMLAVVVCAEPSSVNDRSGAHPLLTLLDANHPVMSHDGGRVVVVPEIGVTEVYEVSTGRRLQSFRIPESFGNAISADGQRVAIFTRPITGYLPNNHYTTKTEFRLFDAASGKELRRADAELKREGVVIVSLSVYGGAGQSMRNISADLRLIAVPFLHSARLPEEKSGVIIGDVETGSIVRRFGEWENIFDRWSQVEMTPDARLLAATRSNINKQERRQTFVWDAQTGRELLRLPFYCWWLALSDDGRTLVTTNGETYQTEAWDIATGKRISEIGAKGDEKRYIRVRGALSPDGKLLATTGTNFLLLWNTQTGRLVAAQPHVSNPDEDIVHKVAFSGDGRYVLMGSLGEVVKVWLLADVLKAARVGK
ncbi:MAG: WD40 repeat domain-containing protein [Pyrinomonadaceae bacterium]|nr:WD40 repeat domain-containing protein [Pyrinomonadaceae bacterium]